MCARKGISMVQKTIKGWTRQHGEDLNDAQVLFLAVNTIKELEVRITTLEIQVSDHESKKSLCYSCKEWLEHTDLKYGVCLSCHLENDESWNLMFEYERKRRGQESVSLKQKMFMMTALAHWFQTRQTSLTFNKNDTRNSLENVHLNDAIDATLEHASHWIWEKSNVIDRPDETKNLSGQEAIAYFSAWRFDPKTNRWYDRRLA